MTEYGYNSKGSVGTYRNLRQFRSANVNLRELTEREFDALQVHRVDARGSSTPLNVTAGSLIAAHADAEELVFEESGQKHWVNAVYADRELEVLRLHVQKTRPDGQSLGYPAAAKGYHG